MVSNLGVGWMQGLVRQAEIIDTEASDSEEDDCSGSSGPEHQLYTRGQRSHHFTLVLQACFSELAALSEALQERWTTFPPRTLPYTAEEVI